MLPFPGNGIERSPWLSTDYELQAKADYAYQSFQNVSSAHGTFHEPLRDHFINFSLGGSYYDWDEKSDWNFYGEVGVTWASNKWQMFGVDCFYAAGRYQIMDDVNLADPFSLVIGAVLTKATKHALHNMGSFHHGQFEGGIYLSAGKEFDWHEFWVWRTWGSVGIGVADVGSPWINGSLHLENNFKGAHRAWLFITGLYGMGGNSLKPHMHFIGYGPIGHRSLDLGVGYSYTFESEGVLSLAYTHRFYSRNFPSNANLIAISFDYPFSL